MRGELHGMFKLERLSGLRPASRAPVTAHVIRAVTIASRCHGFRGGAGVDCLIWSRHGLPVSRDNVWASAPSWAQAGRQATESLGCTPEMRNGIRGLGGLANGET